VVMNGQIVVRHRMRLTGSFEPTGSSTALHGREVPPGGEEDPGEPRPALACSVSNDLCAQRPLDSPVGGVSFYGERRGGGRTIPSTPEWRCQERAMGEISHAALL